VDFDGDHHRDLWNNTADAIGSVGYYLKSHGWRSNQPVADQVNAPTEVAAALAEKGIKTHSSVAELRRLGVEIPRSVSDDLMAALIALETGDAPEYWLGYDNFYVITRYNHSALYAMAVHQLSREIIKQAASTAAN
jgi:membrane-bound lytic murein transglycosylase B